MSEFADTQSRLISHLREAQATHALRDLSVVIMNDFSLDHMVPVAEYAAFDAHARRVLVQKGGILLASGQTLQQGGCAANTATTLGRLGVRCYFIARTSPIGAVLLDFFLGRAGVDLSHVKQDGTLALMMALEVGEQKTNIMVNDIQSFAPFGFDDLDAADLQLIESATLVGVFDWCLNRKGTDLAAGLLDHLAAKPRCAHVVTYLDTSDPAPRKEDVPGLWRRVLTHPRLDYLGINENELRHYANDLTASDTRESLAALARTLEGSIPATVVAHTASFSLQVRDGAEEGVWIVPSYELQPVRTTGAGDSWNGGNIVGLLLGLEPDERLLLANAVAGYYIAAPNGERPNLDELISFLEHHSNRLRPLTHLPATGIPDTAREAK